MSTSLAYGELLAFEGLQGSVEHLYRVYLDAVLVQLKRDAGADSTEYWKQVATFRQKKVVSEAALPAFRYWYDVRARFWESQDPNNIALNTFPYKREIETLHAQAEGLKARLDRLAHLQQLAAQNSQALGAPAPSGLYKPQQQGQSAAKSTALITKLMAVDTDPLKVMDP